MGSYHGSGFSQYQMGRQNIGDLLHFVVGPLNKSINRP